MPQISFITPALITLGVLSTIVPIIIHFSINKKPQVVHLPTFRFLQKTKMTGKMFRVKQWLLLLMRIFLLILFSMILARPKLYSTWFSNFSNSRVTNAVILIDDTLSMDYQESGKTRFELAKEKAFEVLTQLEPPSKICLYPITQGPKQFTIDFETIRTEIKRLQCSKTHKSSQGALLTSKALLEELKEEGDIFLISDFARKGFGPLTSRGLFDKVNVHLIPIRSKTQTNASILEVVLPSSNIPVGGIVSFNCKILSSDSKPTERELALYIGNEKKQQKRLTLPGKGEVSTAEFSYKISKIGIFHGKVVLEGEDSILEDNTYYFTIRVLPPLQILILAEPEQFEQLKPAFLLLNILNPRGLRLDRQFSVQKITPENFFQTDLKDVDLLFLFTLPKEGILAANRLKEFLEMRGSLVFFAQSDPVYDEMLPKLGAVLSTPTTFENSGHGFLTPFKTGQYGNLSEPIIPSYQQILYQDKSPYEVLLRYKNGDPAITQQSIGAGSVVYLSFELKLTPKGLPTNPVVVPFFHLLTRSLLNQFAPIPKPTNREPVSYRLNDNELGASIKLLLPGAKKMLSLDLPPASNHITIDNTEISGPYELFIKSSSGLRKEGFSVNIPEEEKDILPINLEELKKYVGKTVAEEEKEPIQKTKKSTKPKEKKASEQEIYAYIMLFLILLITFESIFSNRI